ncbi:conserved exported hypothetical protein [Candidatus Sulfopaludibacter sp. SbA3]|nr:conserved exported hypothetical protein [Candidatus Sulfopaludibacter sp. SbA3]
MKIASWILALALAAPLMAQPPKLPPSLERLAEKAKNSAEVTLDGPLLKLTARFLSDKDSDEATAKKSLEGIEGIYVRTYEFDRDAVYSDADLNELRAQYRAPEWSRIVGVRCSDDGDNADIFFKVTADGHLSGVAIVAAGPRELTLVSIVGKIDPADFMNLGGRYHIPKLELSPKQFRRMEP